MQNKRGYLKRSISAFENTLKVWYYARKQCNKTVFEYEHSIKKFV